MRAHGPIFKFHHVLRKPTLYAQCTVRAVSGTCQPRVSEGLQISAVSRDDSGRRDWLVKDQYRLRPGQDEAVRIKSKPLTALLTATLSPMTFGRDVGSCARLWQ
jgi:hypothetical protein